MLPEAGYIRHGSRSFSTPLMLAASHAIIPTDTLRLAFHEAQAVNFANGLSDIAPLRVLAINPRRLVLSGGSGLGVV